MRSVALALAVSLLSASGSAAAQQAGLPTEAPPNPPEVALTEQGAEGFIYKRFPTGERLYLSKGDPIGRSTCNDGCASAWPPVLAPAGAKPVGDWTIIVREDGLRQWALRGRPVYSRFHDLPLEAAEVGQWQQLTQPVALAIVKRS